MNGERILVTGSSGWMGRFLCAALAARGAEVVGCDLVPAPNGGASIVGDLAAGPPDLGAAAFDRVFHLAGKAHSVPRSKGEADAFHTINTDGTRHLLQALTGAPPAALVFVSTVAVYGLESGSLIDEGAALAATDPYGLSKVRAEGLWREWAAEHGARAVVVRPPLVAGPGCPGNLGAMIASLEAGRYANVAGGLARRSVVCADDLVRGLIDLSDLEGTYHLTDGRHPSFAELSGAFAAAMGLRRPLSIPGPPARALGLAGDVLTAVMGRAAPFDSNRRRKMTSTLTFDDAAARSAIDWNPRSVLERVEWILGRACVSHGPRE